MDRHDHERRAMGEFGRAFGVRNVVQPNHGAYLYREKFNGDCFDALKAMGKPRR